MNTPTFEEIISLENLLLAWKEFLKGKKSKKDMQEFQYGLFENIFRLHSDLKNKTYTLACSTQGVVFAASSTRHVGITWCAGDLSVNVAAAVLGCDGEALGNVAQICFFGKRFCF